MEKAAGRREETRARRFCFEGQGPVEGYGTPPAFHGRNGHRPGRSCLLNKRPLPSRIVSAGKPLGVGLPRLVDAISRCPTYLFDDNDTIPLGEVQIARVVGVVVVHRLEQLKFGCPTSVFPLSKNEKKSLMLTKRLLANSPSASNILPAPLTEL